ncbi:uncharacterized protein LOC112269844 isoform X1 [Brachypodium distachyon]|uniref:FBD domain-containing protein n=1 Tax=Brachypodium distachyon TaxID=15368 RepID=A0A2K2DSC2_BRADI|nr:uncharacterized protein LOC112269844 isoform X1 [Brachypodium distachyon]PNT77177.1 hypothetical protein BRADI_1g58767v3 [Brachypodium distachyon]|eukprot:XP_024312955.1 uncharacterized protein LOC112269844 isoform X1 [Brachypodium distachyon]
MTVKFGEMEHLEWLATPFLLAYGPPGLAHNRHCLRLLQQFEAVQTFNLVLLACLPANIEDMDHPHYLIEEMVRLPDIRSLNLFLFTNGHSFGASSFHLLRMRTGIRKLGLVFDSCKDVEVATTCASGCICDQPTNWKTEELVLRRLQDIEIQFLSGTAHDFALVEQLFSWATAVKTVTVSFNRSITGSMANEFCQRILGFSRPEICVKFYVYRPHK